MAIVSMKRMELYGLRKHKSVFVKELQRLGLVEPVDLNQEALEDAPAYREQLLANDAELTQLNRIISLFDRFAPQQPNLVEQFAGMKTVMTWEERNNLLAREAELPEVKRQVLEGETELNRLEQEIAYYEREIAELRPWMKLDLKAEAWSGSKRFRVFLGSVEGKTDQLRSGLNQAEYPYVLEEIGSKDDRVFFLLIHPRTVDVSAVLKDTGATESLPHLKSGRVSDRIEELIQAVDSMGKARGEMREKLQQWAEYRPMVEVFYDQALNNKIRLEADRRLLMGKKSFALQGWVEEHQVDRVNQVLHGLNLPCHLAFFDPQPEEEAPIAIKNTALVSPFEALISSFSYPRDHEIDPTPVVAPFFFIFFGIALGDAGYGLTLAAFCSLLLLKLVMRPTGKKLAMMFLVSGLGAVVGGLITSSVFGYRFYTGAVDIMNQPLLLLGFVLGLGVLQLYVGVICSAWVNVKNGKWQDAVWNQGFWLMFLTGLLLVMGKDALGLGAYSGLINTITLGSAALLMIANTRGRKGWLAKLIALPGGLFTLYGSIGFFSDVLSYSRLMALGLAGSVMATVINGFVSSTWNFPYVGWLFAIVIFVGGHAFNLGLSVLGAYVHSSRLQYLEFFSKFFEGGGEAFAPLKWENKYIYLTKEREV